MRKLSFIKTRLPLEGGVLVGNATLSNGELNIEPGYSYAIYKDFDEIKQMSTNGGNVNIDITIKTQPSSFLGIAFLRASSNNFIAISTTSAGSGAKLYFEFRVGGVLKNYRVESGEQPLNTRTRYTLTFDKTTFRLYVDGVLTSSFSSLTGVLLGTYPTTTYTTIGGFDSSGLRSSAHTTIHSVSFSRNALTDDDILEDMAGTLGASIIEEGSLDWLNLDTEFGDWVDSSLIDGDMSAADASAWTASNATLSKETCAEATSGKCLRITADGAGYALAYQSCAISGGTYRIRGKAKSDGTGVPEVTLGGLAWTGTNSTSVQEFDVTITASSTNLSLRHNEGVGVYVEFTDITVELLQLQTKNIGIGDNFKVGDGIGNYKPENVGNGFRWDGSTNKYLLGGTSTAFNSITFLATVEGGLGTYRRLCQKNTNQISLLLWNDDTFKAYVGGSLIESTIVVPEGLHAFTIVKDGSQIRTYVDDQVGGVGALIGPPSGTGNLIIGQSSTAGLPVGGQLWNGIIHNMVRKSEVLTQEEVFALHKKLKAQL